MFLINFSIYYTQGGRERDRHVGRQAGRLTDRQRERQAESV